MAAFTAFRATVALRQLVQTSAASAKAAESLARKSGSVLAASVGTAQKTPTVKLGQSSGETTKREASKRRENGHNSAARHRGGAKAASGSGYPDMPQSSNPHRMRLEEVQVINWKTYAALEKDEKRRFHNIVLQHVPKSYTLADIFDRLVDGGVISTETHSIRDIMFPPPSCPRMVSLTRPVFLKMPRTVPGFKYHDHLRAVFQKLQNDPLFLHPSTSNDTHPLIAEKHEHGFYPHLTNAPGRAWQRMLMHREEKNFMRSRARKGEEGEVERFHRDVFQKHEEQSGRRVLLFGLPYGAPEWVVQGYVRDFTLDDGTDANIIKLPGHPNRLNNFWLLIAKTVDEAYRMVRHLNMLPHIAPSGTRYMMRAEVCW